MTKNQDNENVETNNKRNGKSMKGLYITIIITVICITFIVSIYFINSCAEKSIGTIENGIQNLVKAFNSGDITTKFISQATKVTGTIRLQVVEFHQNETFDETSTGRLGNVRTLINVPVVYVYYIDFNDEWRMTLDEYSKTINIYTPQLRFNDPSIDTSKINIIQDSSPLRFDESNLREKLILKISEYCKKRANDNIHNGFISLTAKAQVENFVNKLIGISNQILPQIFQEYGENNFNQYKINVIIPELNSNPNSGQPVYQQ